MPSELSYVTAEELADYLRREKPSTVVLDVRDDDFADLGHIRGAVNISAWELLSTGSALDKFIGAHLRRAETRRVVVHCYLSMQRGPSVASRLKERLQQLDDPALLAPADVLILRKGFRAFFSEFKNDEDLVARH